METPKEPNRPALSRKDFLKRSLQQVAHHVAEALPSFEVPVLEDGFLALRPPGALAETNFLQMCEPFCNECRDVCPREAIQRDALGYPVIIAEEAPCVMCTDVPCTRVCPTEALKLLTAPTQIAMGTATIELTVCTAYQASGCTVCVEVCPLPEVAIQVVEGLPQVIPEGCTGCGVCVYECPTPGAIFILPSAVTAGSC